LYDHSSSSSSSSSSRQCSSSRDDSFTSSCILFASSTFFLDNNNNVLQLKNHPALAALAVDLRPRSRLKPHHESLFQDDDDNDDDDDLYYDDNEDRGGDVRLLNRLGRVCCRSGVVSRKEFFETYAAAVAIQAAFPNARRIADIAAGHGLLAWFLLALADKENEMCTSTTPSPRTVVCIDRRIPPQATERIADVMRNEFGKQFADRWTYVEADISSCLSHASCLLVSVHGCGSLTDDLIAMAIDARAACAVVPCCHTIRPGGAYRPHVLAGMTIQEITNRVEEGKKKTSSDLDHQVANDKHLIVANVVDEVRRQTLQRAGYHVHEVQLPKAFTARNRLLLATPLSSFSSSCTLAANNMDPISPYSQAKSSDSLRNRHVPSLRISLADDPESIAYCRAVSGKERSMERLMKQIPRHFSITLALSIWLPSNNVVDVDDGSGSSLLTLNDLQHLANRIGKKDDNEDGPGLKCKVMQASASDDDDGVSCNKDGRCSQLYKFQYTRIDGGNMSGEARRIQAKRFHQVLRESIVEQYGNILR
jgi:Methyltransferase domain